MVCQGTRKFVLIELKKLGLKMKSFESGEIEFHRQLTSKETDELIYSLRKYGLEVSVRRHAGEINFAINEPEPMIEIGQFPVDKTVKMIIDKSVVLSNILE